MFVCFFKLFIANISHLGLFLNICFYSGSSQVQSLLTETIVNLPFDFLKPPTEVHFSSRTCVHAKTYLGCKMTLGRWFGLLVPFLPSCLFISPSVPTPLFSLNLPSRLPYLLFLYLLYLDRGNSLMLCKHIS